MSCGDNHAGCQALDVPFPWRRQSFVEIIDVEENVALRGSETAEIHEVSVAAGLHADPGCRGRSQIGGHQGGRAPIEGEGRLRHSSETDRDQLRDAPFVETLGGDQWGRVVYRAPSSRREPPAAWRRAAPCPRLAALRWIRIRHRSPRLWSREYFRRSPYAYVAAPCRNIRFPAGFRRVDPNTLSFRLPLASFGDRTDRLQKSPACSATNRSDDGRVS